MVCLFRSIRYKALGTYVHTVHTIRFVHAVPYDLYMPYIRYIMVHTVHTVHTVRSVHSVHTVHIVHTVPYPTGPCRTWHYVLDHRQPATSFSISLSVYLFPLLRRVPTFPCPSSLLPGFPIHLSLPLPFPYPSP